MVLLCAGAIIVIAGIFMTWSDVSDTTCVVEQGQRMVLYGGEGNKARILQPGEHSMAGWAYEHDYVVDVGRVIETKFEVRRDQGATAGIGHLVGRHSWTKDTIFGQAAQIVTPQPTFIKVRMSYTLDDASLQRLVNDSNEAPFEQAIFAGLVLKAFDHAEEKADDDEGMIAAGWKFVTGRDEEEDRKDLDGRMRSYLSEQLGNEYGVKLDEFVLIGKEQRDLRSDEPIRPLHLSANPAPATAKIQTAPTVFGAFFGNIGKILMGLFFMVAIAFWTVFGP